MKNEVYWDPNEKTIGIVGIAPYATADFYRKIIDATPAKKDWENIRILIDNNPKIPSRGRAIELGETDPSPQILDTINELGDRGADFAVIPCNTVHYFFDSFSKGTNIPVLNFIEETANYVVNFMPEIKNVGLIASKITTQYKLYDKYLSSKGVVVHTLPEEQQTISEIIESVKVGNKEFSDVEKVRAIALKLIEKGIEALILGCTEISLLLHDGDLSVPIFDSNEVMAKVCVRKAQNNDE